MANLVRAFAFDESLGQAKGFLKVVRYLELGPAQTGQTLWLAGKDPADRLAESAEINDVYIVIQSKLDSVRGERSRAQDDDLVYAADGIFFMLRELGEREDYALAAGAYLRAVGIDEEVCFHLNTGYPC